MRFRTRGGFEGGAAGESRRGGMFWMAAVLAWVAVITPAWGQRAEGEGHAGPPLAEVTRIFAMGSGERLGFGELLDAVVGKDVVFLGESHLDEVTHRFELAVYEGLIARKEGKVVLAMEMFERDVQPVLDAYLKGTIGEEEFLEKARPWSNYRTGYRRLIETAKRHGLPVVASNFPVMLRRRVAFGGKKVLESLSGEQKSWVPAELFDNGDAYWERFARTLRGGHMAGMVLDPERRLTMSQSLWDNTMGESCAKALDAFPGYLVLHVNGGFHSEYRGGTVAQLLKRKPEAKVAVIGIGVVPDLNRAEVPRDRSVADYVVYADGYARGIFEGFRGVRHAGELRYRMHLPEQASGAAPLPLLIWLHDDGGRAEGDLALWRSALGDTAAIVAVEAPYPLVGPDLALGGRWFWPETYREDLPGVQWSLATLRDYVARHWPVDPERVLLAGEGTGATVVAAAITLGGSRMEVPGVAMMPRRFARLREIPMPEPAEVGGGALEVLAPSADAAWWNEEASSSREIGIAAMVTELPQASWERMQILDARIRAGLGLPSIEIPAAPADRRRVLLVHADGNPRAARWARLTGLALERAGAQVAVSPSSELAAFAASERPWEVLPLALAWEDLALTALPAAWKRLSPYRAEDLADARYIPTAPGSFGGVTVLILPRSTPMEARLALQKVAESGAIRRYNRFAELRLIVEGKEEVGIAEVLSQIAQQGKSSVLILPAVYCASIEDMRRFESEVRGFEDRLDIAWLPGLGGELSRKPPGE